MPWLIAALALSLCAAGYFYSRDKKAEVAPTVQRSEARESTPIGSAQFIGRETEAPPPEHNDSEMVALEATARKDTDVGTAVRLGWKLPPNSDFEMLIDDKKLKIDVSKSYLDVFVVNTSHFALKVKTSTGEITKDLVIAPTANNIGSFDSLDIITGLASEEDFSIADSHAMEDPLSGWLSWWLNAASSDDLVAAAGMMLPRHGLIFSERKDIQSALEKRAWYKGDTTSDEVAKARFSSLEEKNTNWLLKTAKTKRGDQ